MIDIVRRLRAEVTENKRYEVTGTLALEAADEITRLTAEVTRLKAVEADYDLHEREMIDLEEDNGRLTAENEKLRAALEPLACTCDRPNGAACSRSEADCPFWNARTVLEGK